jgi:hypothetical protein
MISNTAQTI